MKKIKKMIMVLVVLVLAIPALAEEKLVLATLDWEPYIGQAIKDNGYVAVLVKEAFKRSGADVTFQFNQWSRTLGLAKTGQVDGYFPEYYAEGVKEYAIFSEPFPGGPLGFFALKKNKITYNTLEDLKPYKIGTVQGYLNTPEFDDAEFITKDPAKDDLTNFKKLIAGRLDLLVADKFVGTYIMKQNMPDQMDQIEFLTNPLAEPDLYVCISKKKPNAQALVDMFNKGLLQLKDEGMIDKILKDSGF